MIRLVGKSKFRLLSLFILFSLILTGCGSDFASPYSTSVLASEMAGRGFTADLRADAYAKDLCVITENVPVEGLELSTAVESYLLIDINNRTALAAYDVNRQIHPASTTHSQLTDEELLSTGIRPNTIRLSIGTEHIDDIIADLENGFAAI